MPFDTAYTELDFPEQVGLRDDATGNLGASWTVVQGAASDIQVKADTVNIAWSPTTATSAVTTIYSSRTTAAPWFRLSAAQRFVSTPAGAAVAIGAWASDSMGTFGFTPRLFTFVLQSDAPTRIRFLWQGVGDKAINTPLTANLWYRTGIEVIGNRIRFLFNPTGNANITNVSNDADMAVYYEAGSIYTKDSLFFGMSLSAKAQSAVDYTGIGDIRFTALQQQTGEMGGGLYPMSFNFTPYNKYKSVRQITKTLENLVLTP